MLKNSNSVTIYGFMLTTLCLKTWTELICFATIFSFFYSNKVFKLSGISYLCNWCGADFIKVSEALDFLESQGLIIINKDHITINKSELIKLGVLKNDDKIVIA